MKELKDRELLYHYLREHHIESVFHEQVIPHLALYSFDLGELVCTQGQPSHCLYVLVKGKVKIYNTSAEGKTLILSFKKPVEVIGDIEYVRKTDIINTVEAVSTVHMIGVPYRLLQRPSHEQGAFLDFLLRIITEKFFLKSTSLSFNLLHPVEVRLASYLLSVSFDEADALYSGQVIRVNLMDAANLISTSYRHLNRVIQQFCAQGLVERSKGSILVKDRKGLSKLAQHNIYE